MITKKHIKETVLNEYIAYLSDWNVNPVIRLNEIIIKNTRALGIASSNGNITINSSFVGTELYDELIDTIRHEIAHLVVGINQGHNNVWKACCLRIGCNPNRSTNVKDEKFITNHYNYALYAEFVDGSEILVGRYKRRSQKFIKAKPHQYSIKGRPIVRFYFKDVEYSVNKDKS